MTIPQHERVADLVRQELPYKGIYTLIALNVAVLLVTVFLGFHFWSKQQTQDQWIVSLRGQLEGLKATVEFGPRITALEQGQYRQTTVLEAIAVELGIDLEDTP